jgi:hypothetical protein
MRVAIGILAAVYPCVASVAVSFAQYTYEMSRRGPTAPTSPTVYAAYGAALVATCMIGGGLAFATRPSRNTWIGRGGVVVAWSIVATTLVIMALFGLLVLDLSSVRDAVTGLSVVWGFAIAVSSLAGAMTVAVASKRGHVGLLLAAAISTLPAILPLLMWIIAQPWMSAGTG